MFHVQEFIPAVPRHAAGAADVLRPRGGHAAAVRGVRPRRPARVLLRQEPGELRLGARDVQVRQVPHPRRRQR